MQEKNKEIEIFERLSKVEAKIDTILETVNSIKHSFEKLKEKYNDEIREIYESLDEIWDRISELSSLKRWVQLLEGTMVSLLGVLIVYLVKMILKV
jgi:FtsZ-binding cell division protein ZapB